MEDDLNDNYYSVDEFFESQETFAGNEPDSTYNEDGEKRETSRFTSCSSWTKHVKTSLELSVMLGILFGLFTTFLWWIELNVKPYCLSGWDDIPLKTRHLILLVESVKVVIIMFWPLLTVAPICSWSMIRESKLLYCCTIAGFVDVIDRLYFFIFGHYQRPWKSYVGNGIFAVISYTVFYKFTKYRQRQFGNSGSAFLITMKLGMQIISGLIIFLPYNYLFLHFYSRSKPLMRTILSCSLIVVFYIPKLIICNLVAHERGIYNENESIVFSAAFLIISTMVARLTQARIEELPYFTFVCVVHGVFNVIDKVALPVKEKLCNTVCKKVNHVTGRNVYFTHYTAHQSLISIITETTSVIMSNAAAYLLVYYYKKEEVTGKRYDGRILFKDMLIRSSIAVCIEWAFNVVALKLQNDSYKFPVLKLWKRQWKFILVIHLIHIIYVVVYFAYHVDYMLLGDLARNSHLNCTGGFKRL